MEGKSNKKYLEGNRKRLELAGVSSYRDSSEVVICFLFCHLSLKLGILGIILAHFIRPLKIPF